jgi:hypothetical protein
MQVDNVMFTIYLYWEQGRAWKTSWNVFLNWTSVNINASYIEALLGKMLIRCKIYFLRTFCIYRPSYLDVFQAICLSCFLDNFSQTLSTPNVINKKDETYLFYIFIFLCTWKHLIKMIFLFFTSIFLLSCRYFTYVVPTVGDGVLLAPSPNASLIFFSFSSLSFLSPSHPLKHL